MMSDTPTTPPAEEQQIQPDAPTTETVGDGPDAPVIPDAPEGADLFDPPAAGGDIYSGPIAEDYAPSPGDVAAARGVDAPEPVNTDNDFRGPDGEVVDPAEHDGHTIDLGAPSQVIDDDLAGALAAADEDEALADELAEDEIPDDEELDEDTDEVDHDQTATVEGEPGVDFPGTAKTI